MIEASAFAVSARSQTAREIRVRHGPRSANAPRNGCLR